MERTDIILLVAVLLLATMKRQDKHPKKMFVPFPLLDVVPSNESPLFAPLMYLLFSLIFLLSVMPKAEPLTPEQKRKNMHALKILLIVTFSAQTAAAQFADSFPGPGELFKTLRTYHEAAAAANIERLNRHTKTDWMHWMPSVGVTLGKPSISFSLSQVVANVERKADRKAEIQSLLRGANLAFINDSFTLVSLIQKREILQNSMIWLESIERIENEKFELDKLKYEKAEITPSDWLNIKAAHLRGGEAYFRRREEIQILETEIRKTAKF